MSDLTDSKQLDIVHRIVTARTDYELLLAQLELRDHIVTRQRMQPKPRGAWSALLEWIGW